MALRHWAFFYTAPGTLSDGTVTVVETTACKTVLVGVPRADDAVPIAKRLVDEAVHPSSR
jgi:hypothetical protein